MRDLITIITESRGLGARKPGEEFVSTTNSEDKIYVDSVVFYPQGQTAYPDYNTMANDLNQLAQGMSAAAIDIVGTFKPTDRAFGIATFTRLDGSKLVWVKPFKEIKLDPTANNWNNQTGIPGFKYNSRSAAKTQAGMSPQDVLTQASDLGAGDIVAQIAERFGAESPLTQYAQQIAAGAKLPIVIQADENMSFTAFRDYFNEMLHPVVLQTGNYSGNAADAAEQFLGGSSYSDCAISFGHDKTEGLSDSVMIAPNGMKIKISSKGASGAEASVSNLLDAAQELRQSNPKLLKKHQEVLGLIEDIKSAKQRGAPLVLGTRYNIITTQEAKTIQGLDGASLVNLDNKDQIKKILGGSKTLVNLAYGRNVANPAQVNLFYHLLAAVAHQAAEHVNEQTNFSDAASEILNNGALVQVYTDATESKGQWTVRGFRTVWPSSTVTGVKFSAGKTYYSTGIKGNFTFKILKNGAKDVPDETSDVEDLSATKPAKKLKAPGTSMSADVVKPRARRGEPKSDLGRGRR